MPLQQDFIVSPAMRPPPEFQSDLRLWADGWTDILVANAALKYVVRPTKVVLKTRPIISHADAAMLLIEQRRRQQQQQQRQQQFLYSMTVMYIM